MARSRNIKPGFFQNDELAECGIEAHLLFAGLWTIADKEGRLRDRPKRIKASCLPYYQVNVDSCLDQLWNAGFLVRYEIDGERFIQIENWSKHQSPHHKEMESEIPEPPENSLENKAESNVAPTSRQAYPKHEPSLPQAPVKGIRNQESGIRLKQSAINDQESGILGDFERWWSVVHCKTARGAAKIAYTKAIKRLTMSGREDPHGYLLDRMRLFAASPVAKPPDRSPIHPSTWLNQDRFDDDESEWQRKQSASEVVPI